MRSKPYHKWSRLFTTYRATDSDIQAIPNTSGVFPIGNTYQENEPDDVVERTFLRVKVGGMVTPTSAEVNVSNSWIAAVDPLVCVAVTSIGSGVVPDPTDPTNSDSTIVLTGRLKLDAAGPAWHARSGFQTEQWAVWSGDFESQGMRLSPLTGTGPAVQAALYFNDESGQSFHVTGGPISSWYVSSYLMGLFASRVPY